MNQNHHGKWSWTNRHGQRTGQRPLACADRDLLLAKGVSLHVTRRRILNVCRCWCKEKAGGAFRLVEHYLDVERSVLKVAGKDDDRVLAAFFSSCLACLFERTRLGQHGSPRLAQLRFGQRSRSEEHTSELQSRFGI